MFRRASLGRTLLSSGGGRSKTVMERFRSSSYFRGNSGKGSLGCWDIVLVAGDVGALGEPIGSKDCSKNCGQFDQGPEIRGAVVNGESHLA